MEARSLMNKNLLDLTRELTEAAPYLSMLAEQPELAGVCAISLGTETGTGHMEVRAYVGHLLGPGWLNEADESACIDALRTLAGRLSGQFRLGKPIVHADGSSFRALDVVLPMPGGGSLVAWADIAHLPAPVVTAV
jgi:hypothetical protein